MASACARRIANESVMLRGAAEVGHRQHYLYSPRASRVERVASKTEPLRSVPNLTLSVLTEFVAAHRMMVDSHGVSAQCGAAPS